MTSALTLSASQQALGQFPMTSDIPTSSGRAYPMPILRCATRVGLTAEHGRATGGGTSTQAQRLSGSLPYWELELVPGRRQNGSGWSLRTGG